MANNDNLSGHGFNEITAEEQREIARKGGKASVEARRKKKTMREAAQVLFQLELSDAEKEKLNEKGYNAETQVDALVVAAMQGAKRGNSQMFANLMRLMGEGSESIELTVTDDSSKAMDAFFENERENFKSDRE